MHETGGVDLARRRYPGSGTTFALLLAALVILVFASPLAVRWIASWGFHWNLLSNVGQAYGFAAALLSGLALAAIGISLFFQSRQTRIAQLQAARTLQLELFKLAYEHPDLQEGWSPRVDVPYLEWRKRSYMNLVFMYLRMNYIMGGTTDAELHRIMANRFKTRPGRDYWITSRQVFSAGAQGRRDRRFFKVAESEYQKSVQHPPLDYQNKDGSGPADLGSLMRFTAGGAGVAILMLLISKWRAQVQARRGSRHPGRSRARCVPVSMSLRIPAVF
jgi:hypothetical protein